MEDIQFSLKDMLKNKTGMEPTSIEEAMEPLSGKKVHVVTFENGTRAIVSVHIKLMANGPLMKKD